MDSQFAGGLKVVAVGDDGSSLHCSRFDLADSCSLASLGSEDSTSFGVADVVAVDGSTLGAGEVLAGRCGTVGGGRPVRSVVVVVVVDGDDSNDVVRD